MINEVKILERLYNDFCTVYRNVPTTGVFDDFQEVVIYEDVKCGLSYTKGSTQNLEETQSIIYVATLFVNPFYEIKAGDIVIHKDKKFRCGEGAFYPSHSEIPLLREDIA